MEGFARTARKLLHRHPDLVGVFEDPLQQLEIDPRAPKRCSHALEDTQRDMHAVSLAYECRIVLLLRFTPREVVLLDVGTHDEVYRE